MFYKQPDVKRMFMDCTDTFNWLTINGQAGLAEELKEKADKSSRSIDRQMKQKEREKAAQTYVSKWAKDEMKELERRKENREKPNKKWWKF